MRTAFLTAAMAAVSLTAMPSVATAQSTYRGANQEYRGEVMHSAITAVTCATPTAARMFARRRRNIARTSATRARICARTVERYRAITASIATMITTGASLASRAIMPTAIIATANIIRPGG